MEATFYTIRGFESAVKSFDKLLKRSELSRYSVIVGKTDNLSDIKFKSSTLGLMTSVAVRA